MRDCGLHRASRQIKTASKGIIRKECQSFTNHGHDKTPPTVFNPLSLWLTLPRNMGVSHTVLPPSITRATLACPWFAQGISPNQNSFQGHYPQRMPIIYKPRTRLNATNCIQSAITVADPPSGCGGQPHTMASRHYQSHSCVPVVCTGFHRVQKIKTAEPFLSDCGLHRVSQGTKNQNSRAILE